MSEGLNAEQVIYETEELKRITYDKIVRNLMPRIIEDNSGQPQVDTLNLHDNKEQLINLFKKKIREEVSELLNAKARDEMIEEATDVIQVVEEYISLLHCSKEKLYKVKEAKEILRGSFLDQNKNAVYLESVFIQK